MEIPKKGNLQKRHRRERLPPVIRQEIYTSLDLMGAFNPVRELEKAMANY